MSKTGAICPYCNAPNTVERSRFGPSAGLEKVQCAHCQKSWQEDFGASATLAKSAPPAASSTDLAALRTQIRAQVDELLAKVNALIERRAAASRKFNPQGVEKSDVAQQELTKALSNGKRVTFEAPESGSPKFQTVFSIGSGQRVRSGQPFDVNGVEKSDTADAELRKALGSGKSPAAFVPRD